MVAAGAAQESWCFSVGDDEQQVGQGDERGPVTLADNLSLPDPERPDRAERVHLWAGVVRAAS